MEGDSLHTKPVPSQYPLKPTYLISKEKDALDRILQEIEIELGMVENGYRLKKRVQSLRKQVQLVLAQDKQAMIGLRTEIQDLREHVASLQQKVEELEDTLAIGQVTWEWENHVARFVIPPGERFYLTRRFKQMEDYIKKSGSTAWKEIQSKSTIWGDGHKEMVEILRKDRNIVAHPSIIHLDAIQSMIPELEEQHQQPMQDMLSMLKMTASLMKFGRLAKYYDSNRNFFTEKLEHSHQDAALEIMMSWDRDFEKINGLQNIEHEEAKSHLVKYVGDSEMINYYIAIVDFIKKENGKRLGKFAWQVGGRFSNTTMRPEKQQVLSEWKRLVSLQEAFKATFLHLDKTIAKLHVPDFLPKDLWKHGMEVIDKFWKSS